MLFIWFLISNVIYRFTLRNILCMMMPVLEYYQQVSLWIKKKKDAHSQLINLTQQLIQRNITECWLKLLSRIKGNILITYFHSPSLSLCDIQSFCVCTLSDLSQMFCLSTNTCLMGLNSCFHAMTHHFWRGEKEHTLFICWRCTYISVNRCVRHNLTLHYLLL